MKNNNKLTNLLLVGGVGLGFFLAWETNFLGFRNLFQQAAEKIQDVVTPNNTPPYTGGSMPQAVHKQQYPFPYPYPPTKYPMTVAPTTQGAAHYRIAGTPNLGVMGAGLMANPMLWVDKGGIVSPGSRAALPSAINYGPYKFEAPIFSNARYPILGTNIDYPFIVPPFCPPDQFQGQDGRCYPTPLYP